MGNSAHQFSVLHQRRTAHPLHDTAGDGKQGRVGDAQGQVAIGILPAAAHPLNAHGVVLGGAAQRVVQTSASPVCTSPGAAMGSIVPTFCAGAVQRQYRPVASLPVTMPMLIKIPRAVPRLCQGEALRTPVTVTGTISPESSVKSAPVSTSE